MVFGAMGCSSDETSADCAADGDDGDDGAENKGRSIGPLVDAGSTADITNTDGPPENATAQKVSCEPEDSLNSTTGIRCGLLVGVLTACSAAGLSTAVAAFDGAAIVAALKTALATHLNLVIGAVNATGIVLSNELGGSGEAPPDLLNAIATLASLLGITNLVGKTIGEVLDAIGNAITGFLSECKAYLDATKKCIVEIGDRSVDDVPFTPPITAGWGPMWAAGCIADAMNISSVFGTSDTKRKSECKDCCQRQYSHAQGVVTDPDVFNKELPGAYAYCAERCNAWFSN